MSELGRKKKSLWTKNATNNAAQAIGMFCSHVLFWTHQMT